MVAKTILVPSKELVLREFALIKSGGESEILNLCMAYASVNTEKCISITQNLCIELSKSKVIKPRKISTFFSLEREFTDDEIKGDTAISQKKLASELDLDNEQVYYFSHDEEDLKLVKANYEVNVLTLAEAIEKVKGLL